MREHLDVILLHVRLLHIGVFKRRKVCCSLVANTLHTDDFLIAVRNDHRCEDHDQYNQKQNNNGEHCQRIASETPHAVLKEGCGLRHDILLLLLFCGCLFKFSRIKLEAEQPFLRCGNIVILCHLVPPSFNPV